MRKYLIYLHRSFINFGKTALIYGATVLASFCFNFSEAHAHSAKKRFYKSVYTNIGYSNVNVTTSSRPLLMQYSLGAAFAKNIKSRGFIGVTSDYRWINQYSNVTIAGNFRGTRWNLISPLFGVYIKRWVLTLDLQFLGDYALTYTTAEKASVTYKSLLGGRVTLLKPIGKGDRLNLAIFFEQVQFKKQSISTSTTETTLSPVMKIINGGLGLHYLF